MAAKAGNPALKCRATQRRRYEVPLRGTGKYLILNPAKRVFCGARAVQPCVSTHGSETMPELFAVAFSIPAAPASQPKPHLQ